jgi:hypothetical protein
MFVDGCVRALMLIGSEHIVIVEDIMCGEGMRQDDESV